MRTDRGVFSYREIDQGTEILLRQAPTPPAGGNLLDLGCGYGPITLALALRSPKAHVWATDVNERGLELCAANAKAAGLSGRVTVASPVDIARDLRFEAIYSNPPVRIGKNALHELLVGWLPRLKSDGHAYLVVHKNLGSDSLARWLDGEGYPTKRLSSKYGYRVLEVDSTDAPRDRRIAPSS